MHYVEKPQAELADAGVENKKGVPVVFHPDAHGCGGRNVPNVLVLPHLSATGTFAVSPQISWTLN